MADLEVISVGERTLSVWYVGQWKVIVDPEEGSTSCECPAHTAFVEDMLNQPRCAHAAAVWRGMYPEETWGQ